MSAVKFFLALLFLPCLLIFCLGWWIYEKLWGKNQRKRTEKRREFHKKLRTHLYNFSPGRLKNRTWRSVNKYEKKRPKSKLKKQK